MRGIVCIVLFFVSFGVSVVGQEGFVAKVSQKEVAVGDVFEINFIIENVKGDFEPPNFEPFEPVAGPMQSSSFQSINGQVTQSYQFKYLLRASEEGVYLIPEAELVLETEVMFTDPIEIVVLPSHQKKKDRNTRQRPSLQQILRGKEIKRF